MYRGTTDATIENFGYVYKTTNKVNNKIYVGKHKSNRFDENYLGSGVLLSSAIKKYGKENFITEVLEKYHTYPNHIGRCCRKELTFCGKLPDGTKLLWENYEV